MNFSPEDDLTPEQMARAQEPSGSGVPAGLTLFTRPDIAAQLEDGVLLEDLANPEDEDFHAMMRGELGSMSADVAAYPSAYEAYVAALPPGVAPLSLHRWLGILHNGGEIVSKLDPHWAADEPKMARDYADAVGDILLDGCMRDARHLALTSKSHRVSKHAGGQARKIPKRKRK